MTAAEYLERGDGEWVQITCGACGKSSGYERWTKTEISGELPPGEFQCPKCTSAFKREKRDGYSMRLIDGEYQYRSIDLIPMSARL